MKHTFILIPAFLLLSACSGMTMKEVPLAETPTVKFAKPEQDTKIVVLDPDCAALARYAHYVAFLRDSGVTLADAPSLVTEIPAGLAVSVINREVYSRPDVTPEVGQKNSYEICRANSYASMVTALSTAEKKFNETAIEEKKAALAKVKSTKKPPLNKKTS
jgi:hypothetical protein